MRRKGGTYVQYVATPSNRSVKVTCLNSPTNSQHHSDHGYHARGARGAGPPSAARACVLIVRGGPQIVLGNDSLLLMYALSTGTSRARARLALLPVAAGVQPAQASGPAPAPDSPLALPLPPAATEQRFAEGTRMPRRRPAADAD
jgi:hypothetical protein